MAMKTTVTRGVTLIALLLTTASTTQANDIVNFLNALNGNAGRRSAPVAVQPVGHHGHEHDGAAFGDQGYSRDQGYSDDQGYGGHGPGMQYGDTGISRPSVNTVNLRPNHYVAPSARRNSNLQISLQFGANGRQTRSCGTPVYVPAPQPVQVLPPVPVYPSVPVYPHVVPVHFQLGQFIDCQVPLATCVVVQDECNIAPNAVPVVIAVRDPNMCEHEIVERLVYVQIFVPRCQLLDLQISPCRTRICLDYGRYEIDIKSGNGVIVVDYDN